MLNDILPDPSLSTSQGILKPQTEQKSNEMGEPDINMYVPSQEIEWLQHCIAWLYGKSYIKAISYYKSLPFVFKILRWKLWDNSQNIFHHILLLHNLPKYFLRWKVWKSQSPSSKPQYSLNSSTACSNALSSEIFTFRCIINSCNLTLSAAQGKHKILLVWGKN